MIKLQKKFWYYVAKIAHFVEVYADKKYDKICYRLVDAFAEYGDDL